ncbi:MAG: CapA family protein [Patescibacteria group bacterium]
MFIKILIILILILLIFFLCIKKEYVINIEPEKPIELEKPITMIFVGDIILDRTVESLMQEHGFDYPFKNIDLKADFVFANLEGPINMNPINFSRDSLKFSFSFKNIDSLKKAGFNLLGLANNHTLNTGQSGLEETRELLKKSDIEYFGDPVDCSDKYILKKNNFVFIGFNKTQSCSEEQIIDLIEKYENEFVIISIHWGTEYQINRSEKQKDLAYKMIDNGADLIIGHHPHVIQEVEKYKNKMIFYSLGNFVFDQYFSEQTQKGLLIKLSSYSDKDIYEIFLIKSEKSQVFLKEKLETIEINK